AATTSTIPNPEKLLGEETEEKIPKRSEIKQEWQELEVEPLPDPHFGLLGTRNWEIPQGSMDDLPAEILRNIFAFLPVLDLYQNLSLVCHYWREIIRDPQFIPWKKLYHRYVRREACALQRVEQILQGFSIPQEPQGCVLGLVRFVASTGPNVDPSGVLQILGTHPLFPKAQLCVLNKFPDLQSKPGDSLQYFLLFVSDGKFLWNCATCGRGKSEFVFQVIGRADVRLTHEQQRILNHKIEPGQTVKIMAFAGTGKTSTLVKYAEKFQELKFLYLTFNKAVAEKGKEVFPRNVTCKTFHSLAFGSIGRHYKDKGKLNFSKMSVYSISFLLKKRKGQSLFIRGKMVSQTLENFFASSDEEICEEHTPLWFKNTQGLVEQVSREEKRISEINRNLKYLFIILCNYNILVDEAQDCTPAIVDIIQSQKCGKILVGDPHQQIYSFRGAVNCLQCLPHTHLFYLTQVRENKNGGLSARDPPAHIHIIGGLGRFGLSRIYDIWKLSQPAEVRKNSQLEIEDSFIRKWEESEGFVGLKEYSQRVEDRDLQAKICIVEKYKARIPELLLSIQSCHVGQQGLADFLIGTVHQAKGLEFDTVCVSDDFVQIPSATGAFLRRINLTLSRTPEDEWNLLYVAVTRAKKCLLMSKSLENLLTLAGERFLRVELLSEAGKDKDGAPVTCCMSGCSKSLEFSSGLVVKKLPLTYSDGSQDPGGFLCQACTQQFFGPLTPLISFPAVKEEQIQL
ncbi:PREDICTED: F-box DNA helicase 1, partial [Sturnus vulgaris]|uniref:F-box DNA helicase 1 n=1 Tax=Sturnus vulgaris TaxID=9172 RepID=UPI00071A28D6